VHQLDGGRSRVEQVILIMKVGRDFAIFGSEADLAFIVRTLKESVRTF
jgi:hypothetical protein